MPAAQPAADATDVDQALKRVFATALPEFKLREPVAYYDSKGLFEYIDGAAPLYLKHVRLAAAEMATAKGNELTCDIYAMGSEAGAKGIYAAESSSQAKPVQVGDEGRASKMALGFRRGAFYVKLTAFDAAAEAALPQLGQALATRL